MKELVWTQSTHCATWTDNKYGDNFVSGKQTASGEWIADIANVNYCYVVVFVCEVFDFIDCPVLLHTYGCMLHAVKND